MNTKIGTIFCVGRNYANHAKELGNEIPKEPMVFLKAPGSARGLQPIPMGYDDKEFHFETEIVIRLGRSVPLKSEGSWDMVQDLTLGLDLTRREVQNQLKRDGLPWTTAKSFQGSAIIGNFVPKSTFADLNAISFSFNLNGQERQHGNSKDMIFSVPRILTYLSSFISLAKDDLVFTGTPEGVGPFSPGDRFALKFTEMAGSMNGQL